MLDGLLGRGLSSKSKSLIKLIKARIDVIRRKRNAVQKFLKKDVADLLKNGLDVNAYGRAAGLMVELDLSSCYDAVELFCGLVASHLPVMQRQSECPEECKEAVASLMFAAARFADLPELRDLRNIFMEKYGNSLEPFVSQEFVKKLASNPPLVDTKLQLMQDIAKEFSIKWDCKAFELTLSSAPGSLQDQPKRQRSNDPSSDVRKLQTGHGNASLKKELQDVSSFGRPEPADKAHKPQDGRREISMKRDKREISYQEQQSPIDDVYKHDISKAKTFSERDKQDIAGRVYKAHGGWGETTLCRDDQDTLPHGRRGYADNGLKPSNGRENGYLKRDDQQKSFGDESEQEKNRVETLHKRGNQETSSYREQEFTSSYARKQTVKSNHKDIPYASSHCKETPDCATEKVPAEIDSMKPRIKSAIPPPYVKPNVGKYGIQNATSLPDKAPMDHSIYDRDFTNDRSESSQSGLEHTNHERQVSGSARMNGHRDQRTQYSQDELVGDKKLRPRSVRRRQKLPPGNEHMSNGEVDDEIEKRHRRGRRREDVRRNGLQLALDDDCEPTDEEEKMMDRLLMHYSKKPSKYEDGKTRAGLKAKVTPPSHNTAADVGDPLRHQSVDGARTNTGPARIRSLPTESVTPPTEAARLPTRATSFQPDMLNQAGHVHPKLPDYDDLAARFAALRGR